jgi:hypothetical protein
VIIFNADHPRVLDGTYDREGYTPKERRAQARKLSAFVKRKTTMRFFDDDKVGCYLDDIGHRVEKTKDGGEVAMVDLTLRVQPLTPELAVSLDPDVRALLFSLTDGTPKPKIKQLNFNLTVPRQALTVYPLPDLDESIGALHFADVEITAVRARTEKGVDGYGLVFYASFGPVSASELEYVCAWHTQQRFVTFQPQMPALNFDGDEHAATEAEREPARRVPRRNPRTAPVEAGDELRPGVHAQH